MDAVKLRPLYLPGCPHRPTVRQWQALTPSRVREMLYGGAAGGGKSDFLLMAALEHIDVPGYSAIIFRRTFPQLSAPEDGLLARAQEWLTGQPGFQGIDTVNGMPTRWKYKGGGTLSFSHMQLERDKYNHQGPSYQYIGWDELTQFTRTQYLYLMSRQRRLESQKWLPLRVRSASNPGGDGHEWVRERFVDPKTRMDRIFVPSRLGDNPHLDREDYEATLRELPEYERCQLLDGDWDARPPGALFKREHFPIVDAAPEGMEEVRYWDLAATEAKPGKNPDATAGVRVGRLDAGRYVVVDVQHGRWSEAATEQRVLHTAQLDGRGVSIRMEQEPGSSGKLVIHAFRKALEGHDFRGVPSTGSKLVRAKAFIAACERGEVSLVRAAWNEPFLRELEMVTFAGTEHDDQADAVAGAWNALTQRRGVTPDELYGGEDAPQPEAA